jgi:hypothetical protein
MSTKTLRKRIALVAVSAMGFGLLSVVPSANAAVNDGTGASDAAASIASVTVPLVRVGDAKDITVALNYGTTADTYTVGATGDTAIAGSQVRARILSGPTDGSIGATVVSSTNIRGFRTETLTATTARISPTISITPTVAGTYTLLVWVDESNPANAQATVPAVTDRQTTVTFTTAGVPATVNFASTAKSGRVGQTTATSFSYTLRDAAGNPTYLRTGETLSGSVADVTPNPHGGNLFILNGDTTTAGTASAFVTGTPISTSPSVTTGVGAISVASSAAGITRATIVGSGLLTGVVPAVTAELTSVAYGVASKLALATTTGVSNASASDIAPTDPTFIDETTSAGSIWASNVSARSLAYTVTAPASTEIQYTIAAVSTTVALPTGVVAGTYSVTTVTT